MAVGADTAADASINAAADTAANTETAADTGTADTGSDTATNQRWGRTRRIFRGVPAALRTGRADTSDRYQRIFEKLGPM